MARCPICKAPSETETRPFCSERCADIDLGRWMTERYSAPAEEEDLPDIQDIAIARGEGGDGGESGR